MSSDDLIAKLTAPPANPNPRGLRIDRILDTLHEHDPPLAAAFRQVLESDMPARTVEKRMGEIAQLTDLDVSVSDTTVTSWRIRNGVRTA